MVTVLVVVLLVLDKEVMMLNLVSVIFSYFGRFVLIVKIKEVADLFKSTNRIFSAYSNLIQ